MDPEPKLLSELTLTRRASKEMDVHSLHLLHSLHLHSLHLYLTLHTSLHGKVLYCTYRTWLVEMALTSVSQFVLVAMK